MKKTFLVTQYRCKDIFGDADKFYVGAISRKQAIVYAQALRGLSFSKDRVSILRLN